MLTDRLGPALAALDMSLPEETCAALADYGSALLRWNLRINLTGARTPEELVDDHLADALTLLPHLPPHARVVDVGSGAGLPGLVLAIVRPDLRMTLLEPSQKRCAFLSAVRRDQHLTDRLEVRRERMEAHLASEGFRPYDVALSRATWPLEEWLARAPALVARGGRVLGMEGRTETALPTAARRHAVPFGARRRAVIVLPRG